MRSPIPRWLWPLIFITTYVVLDRLSYIEPMFGLNITPWNPPPALALVCYLHAGRRMAPLWFIALFFSEGLSRGLPEGWLITCAMSLWLTLGYGLIAEALRKAFPTREIFSNRRELAIWLRIIVIGSGLNSIGYISMLTLAGHIPLAQWHSALANFWVGDLVGSIVSMPAFWILSTAQGRARMKSLPFKEILACVLLALLLLQIVFMPIYETRLSHFYFLFVPIVWAAGRMGLAGAIVVASVLQIGVIIGAEWGHSNVHSIIEFQLLDSALALVGFFLGLAIDELRQAASDFRRSLRLAAAGDLATALAHELNQPITALAAYGQTCEYLIAHGGSTELLKDTIGRMLNESRRASDVVKRLRNFFRTGSLQLEHVSIDALLEDATEPFAERLKAHHITLVITAQRKGAPLLDRLQIGLVLRNLIGNAIDAVSQTPNPAPCIRVQAELLAGGRFRVSVEDNGPGVSRQIAARLFEPFISSKSSGLGLGLVVSKAIVEAHGGHLWAEIGDHGVFRLELPLAEKVPDVDE